MERIDNKQDIKYQQALERVQEEKNFYNHLIVYVVVISLIWILNYVTTPGNYWAIWATIGWGIGLFFHGLGVFGKNIFFGKSWEERRVREILDKDEKR